MTRTRNAQTSNVSPSARREPEPDGTLDAAHGLRQVAVPSILIVLLLVLPTGTAQGSDEGWRNESLLELPIKVDAGGAHACLLNTLGNVECWGDPSRFPEMPYRDGDAIDVSAGGDQNCILTAAGALKCWGNLDSFYSLPEVGGAVVGISAGDGQTCALYLRGIVECQGWAAPNGRWRYLGGDAVEVSAGHNFACIRLATGNVECRNTWGETIYYTGGDAIDVSAGDGRACVVRAVGLIACFGNHNSDAEERLRDRLNTGLHLGDLDKAIGPFNQVEVGDGFICATIPWGDASCYNEETGEIQFLLPGWFGLSLSASMNHTCLIESYSLLVLCGSPNRRGAWLGAAPRHPTHTDQDDDGFSDAEEALLSCEGNDSASRPPCNLPPDADGDGWHDLVEVIAGCDPNDADSTPPCASLPDADMDGWPDDIEQALGCDATDPASSPPCTSTPDLDEDNDGWPDALEATLGCDPEDAFSATPCVPPGESTTQETTLLSQEGIVFVPGQSGPGSDVGGDELYDGSDPSQVHPGTGTVPVSGLNMYVGTVTTSSEGDNFCMTMELSGQSPIELACVDDSFLLGLEEALEVDVPIWITSEDKELEGTGPVTAPGTDPVYAPRVPADSISTPTYSMDLSVAYRYEASQTDDLIHVAGQSVWGPTDANGLTWYADHGDDVPLIVTITVHEDGDAVGTYAIRVPYLGQAVAAMQATTG